MAQVPTNPNLRRVSVEAAELGVHRTTLHRWIRQGRITGYRVGPQLVMVDHDEVRAEIQPIRARGRAS